MKLSVHLLYPPEPDALAHLRAHLEAGVHLTFGPDLSETDRDVGRLSMAAAVVEDKK